MSICDDQEVSFEVGNPSFLRWFWSSSQVRVQEVGRMFLEADILKNTSFVGQD